MEIPCAAEGAPVPVYLWSRHGHDNPVTLNSRTRQLSGSLFIENVTIADAGGYMCEVDNKLGLQRKATVLEVTGTNTNKR